MKIYCDGEPGLFEESEFLHDGNNILVKPYIHNVQRMHYAVRGIPVDPSTIGTLLNPSGGRNPISIQSLPLVITLNTGESLIQISTGTPIIFYPEREVIVIGPFSSDENDLSKQGILDAEAEQNVRSSLVVQLHQMASELPIDILQRLVNYAKGLGHND